ncbi:sulfurtransferase complex subunit TusC [Vibrio ostreicida]|uniref:Protein TusC homolog n=1 Tax=Vibrio ostreicida TaxID=526588 RepID=A0ABT8BQ07_9VIBR|nr:sulfurtransferase complex subunit TusC [Vibrio ostreicida]MDN3608345.1 sulfurtransferase complex subunit TusC [Vibrio ostreicida]NPD10815.1 sulfurtransferase complex subunit TusC [Vibrio ostreicida]
MSPLTFLFRRAPHGCSSGREGIDALLAASAYCEDIRVIFMGDGVYQLLAEQHPEEILCKHYAPMLKLFDLYDIEKVYVCSQSLSERGLTSADFVIEVHSLKSDELIEQLHQPGKLLSF